MPAASIVMNTPQTKPSMLSTAPSPIPERTFPNRDPNRLKIANTITDDTANASIVEKNRPIFE